MKIAKIGCCIFVFVVLFLSTVHAISTDELTQNAQKAFEEKNYSSAAQSWKTLVEQGYENANLYHNLATAYWYNGELGKARQYFTKASKYQPRDTDIRHSLQVVHQKLNGQKNEVTDDLLKKIPWYKFSLSQSESLKLTACFSLLLFGCLYYMEKKHKYSLRKWVFTFLFFWIFFLGLFSYQFILDNFFTKAVVVANEAPILEVPAPNSSIRAILKEGILVDVDKIQGNYVLIKDDSGLKGWVAKDLVGKI